ncbi:MAG: glycosyltransferase [Acidobacteriota bacterium]|jgi:spore maturation protein CgeB|nr:glycosyltransferase [Acidobacteriota bacterium]
MRLLKLGTYYHTYLQNFYKKQPEIKTQSYAVQHKELIEDCFGASDFWSKALNKLGYETVDIIANAEFLQKTWASENAADFDEDNWLFEIAAEQIKKFRPDILFIADYTTFTAEFIRNIRRECPSIRLVLGWCGAGYFDSSVFREWDIALSCIPEMVADFNKKGIRSFHVNHAFAPRILDKLDLESPPNTDFAFIGSIVKHNKFHIEREQLLIHLVKSTNLQIWADLERPTFKQRYNTSARRKVYDIVNAGKNAGVSEKILNSLPFVRKVAKWDSPPNLEQFVDEQILRRTHPPLFGVEMFQKLRNSRIVFNNHIDVSPISASNMRLFETTGVGACLITDWKENISDLFEPDKEVLTYRSAEECTEKVKYLLEHEDERSAIAAAGQRRTLSEHTFDKRTARIDEIIRRSLTS